MILKNTDILKCVNAMKYLYEKENIPFKTALSISQNASSLDKALKNYLDEKKDIDKKYLKNTSSPFSPADNKNIIEGFEEEYYKELTSLNDKEADVIIEKIDPSQLFGLTFPPKYVDSIAFMLNTR